MKQSTDTSTLDQLTTRRPAWKRWLIRGLVLLLLAGSIGGGAWLWARREQAGKTTFITQDAMQDRLVVTVSATGNLQPTNQVDLGSELSGTIAKVLVEENDHVKRDQVLAQLDLSKLEDQVTKSRAAVESAEAAVQQAVATAAEARANLGRLRHVSELSGGKVPSHTEMATAEATLQRAEANEASARASVRQAEAQLQSDVTNIAKATIRSPINGIVLARKVEPGQTVAASLQAPVLFTIAEDLTQMELQVDVDEADVGQVKPGQRAYFTVDAWPGRQYPASIAQVGYGAQSKDGVVSYKTLLNVTNSDLSLRPGMTATAEITTAVQENALLVPNAALRFTPPNEGQGQKSAGLVASLLPRPPQSADKKKPAKDSSPRVWVIQDGKPVAVAVKTGLSNGRQTQIIDGDLKPGMQVIIEAEKKQK